MVIRQDDKKWLRISDEFDAKSLIICILPQEFGTKTFNYYYSHVWFLLQCESVRYLP